MTETFIDTWSLVSQMPLNRVQTQRRHVLLSCICALKSIVRAASSYFSFFGFFGGLSPDKLLAVNVQMPNPTFCNVGIYKLIQVRTL